MLFLTLALRPVGAFLLGRKADRYDHGPTLTMNMICYSVFELASAFAPTLPVQLFFRAPFGIATGGEWEVGEVLAFETLQGEDAASSRAPAGRPRRRQPLGKVGRCDRLSIRRVAWHVGDWCNSGLAGLLYPFEAW